VRTGNEGQLHPGADDDASGLAVLLELARAMAAGPPPDRPIVFAAFAAEEAGRRGSRKYTAAAALPYPARDAIGMLELDTVGRLGKGKLLVLGAPSAREWVHLFRGAGFVTGVELETPSQELDASDQLSFQEIGVPAVQLTTGPHADYHRPSDTPEKLDGAGLAKVAAVAREAIDYLAGRKEPLTSPQHPPLLSTENASHHPPRPAGGERAGVRGSSSERKVSLGTVPDFAFPGPGVRITGTIPGSPAERVGLIEGDIILMVNGAAIGGMKDF
jgi:Zn-dependent M28 family amino/carboxypeptidase